MQPLEVESMEFAFEGAREVSMAVLKTGRSRTTVAVGLGAEQGFLYTLLAKECWCEKVHYCLYDSRFCILGPNYIL